MQRFARERRVFFVEEPVFSAGIDPALVIDRTASVTVVVPHLPESLIGNDALAVQRCLLEDLRKSEGIGDYVLWFYTPMALPLVDHWRPAAIVYDCMDELSAFRGAPPELVTYEDQLFARASLVLTGGHALYEAKRTRHHNIHPFPSSVDVRHFRQARRIATDPADQAGIGRPRLGFFGVLDERIDMALIDAVAVARPAWQFVLVGPVAKIDLSDLPRQPNIHYLGQKRYEELPAYVAGWDVALMPFAINAATKYISPTKTPEYLAAAKPVVSTAIRDVVQPYGIENLVQIADTPEAFIRGCEAAMAEDAPTRIARADAFLRGTSWDETWRGISRLLEDVLAPAPATSMALLAPQTAST